MLADCLDLRAFLLVTSASLSLLSGCDGESTQMFSGSGATPPASASESSTESTETDEVLDCETIALSATGLYDASDYGGGDSKLSTQWLYIDHERHASLYVDQNSEPGQVARNCYTGGEVDGRNYGLGGYYGTFVSDGACVLHSGLSHTAHLNLRIKNGAEVVSIRAYETGVDETNEEYVENWTVEEGELFADVPGPFSLRAGKISSPTIADIQSQLCESNVDGYYHPDERDAANYFLEN